MQSPVRSSFPVLMLAALLAAQPALAGQTAPAADSAAPAAGGPIAAIAPGATSSDDWHYDLAMYMWATGLQGTMGLGKHQSDADIDFGTILDNLEFAAMGSFQASKGRWAVLTDVFYAGLGSGAEVGRNKKSDVDIDLDQWIVEADGAYRINDWFEVLGGLRYTSLGTTFRLDTPNNSAKGSRSDNWVDPLLGGRVTVPMGERWSFNFRGDVGGLLSGSDFTWQAIARFNARLSKRTSLTFGYRHLDYGYESGSGSEKFTFNIALSGLFAGAIFSF